MSVFSYAMIQYEGGTVHKIPLYGCVNLSNYY